MGEVRLMQGIRNERTLPFCRMLRPQHVPKHCSLAERAQEASCLSPAGDDDGLLPVPGGVVSHDLGMGGDILW